VDLKLPTDPDMIDVRLVSLHLDARELHLKALSYVPRRQDPSTSSFRESDVLNQPH
jgi:hypothetical protein